MVQIAKDDRKDSKRNQVTWAEVAAIAVIMTPIAWVLIEMIKAMKECP